MLRNQAWFDFCDALMIEIEQLSDEGRDVSAFAERAKIIQDMPRGKERTKAGQICLKSLKKYLHRMTERSRPGFPKFRLQPREKSAAKQNRILIKFTAHGSVAVRGVCSDSRWKAGAGRVSTAF